MWIAVGRYSPARHDLYFTIGETVGTPAAPFPSCGVEWHYTPPPVYLPAWPPASAPPTAAYTTVAHWWGEEIEFNGAPINTRRKGSLFLELSRTFHRGSLPTLELGSYHGRRSEGMSGKFWGGYGWRIQDSHEFTATPEEYRSYLQQSRGEFSCAKPSCMQLQNAWISDRTICYLASGKPAIVQHTGPSRFLPDAEGLFRFRDIDEAARMIALVEVRLRPAMPRGTRSGRNLFRCRKGRRARPGKGLCDAHYTKGQHAPYPGGSDDPRLSGSGLAFCRARHCGCI